MDSIFRPAKAPQVLVLFALAIGSQITPEALASSSRGSLKSCVQNVIQVFRFKKASVWPSEDPRYSVLEQKIRSLFLQYSGATLIDRHTFFILNQDLNENEIRLLLSPVRKSLSEKQLRERLHYLSEESLYGWSLQAQIVDTYVRSQQRHASNADSAATAVDDFIDKINDVKNWPPEQKKKIAAEIADRVFVAELDRRLTRLDSELWAVEREANTIKLWNGDTLPVLKQKRNGDLVVGIHIDNVIANQDRIWMETVLEYQADPHLEKFVFTEAILPNGKAFLLDQHHRSSAFSREFSRTLPFLLKAHTASDGSLRYQTSSYLMALRLRGHWSELSLEKKKELNRLLEAAETSANAEQRQAHLQQARRALAEIYKSYMGGK